MPQDKSASRILIYLTEELGDARLRAAQLQRYVAQATDLIEKSEHRDHFFEVAAHLIHGIPQTLFKMSKALDASALAAARLDYEEIKQGLRPEKADELEDVMEDTRLRYLNRRSHEEPMTPKQASDILAALADKTLEAGRVPVTPLLQLIATLEGPGGRTASQGETMAQRAEVCFREASKAILTPGSEPSRMELASLLRRVLADSMPMTSGAMAAAIFAQATGRQDVIDGFMAANPSMSKEDAEKAADEWEKNKDVVKDKTAMTLDEVRAIKDKLVGEMRAAGAGEAFQKANPAITDEQAAKIDEMHAKHKDNFKAASLGGGLMLASPDETAADDKEARHEDGKEMTLEEVTQGMSDEDKAKFKAEHDKNKDNFKAATDKTGRLMSRQEAILKKYVQSGGKSMLFDELPAGVQKDLSRVKDQETLPSDVDRWLSDNNNPHLRSASDGKDEVSYDKRVEKDPTVNMSPEDAAEWKKQNEAHKDEFKTAAKVVPLAEAKKGDMVEVTYKGKKFTGKVVRVKKDGVITVDPMNDDINEGAWIDFNPPKKTASYDRTAMTTEIVVDPDGASQRRPCSSSSGSSIS